MFLPENDYMFIYIYVHVGVYETNVMDVFDKMIKINHDWFRSMTLR